MRIVQVSPYFDPHPGGVEAHVRALSGELVRQGEEVTVLTSRYDPALPEREEKDGYRIVRSRTRAVWLNTPIDPGTRSALARLPADVVHLHYPPPLTSYYAVRGLKGRTTPLCLTYHCDLYLAGPLGAALTTLYEGLFLPATLRRADRIVVHTRSYAETSAMLRGRPVEIIPSAVDLERFRPGRDAGAVRAALGLEGKQVLIFTGRLVPHKGLELLLRAVQGLPENVVLVIVGQGPRLGPLRQLAAHLGIAGRVRFCPNVSDLELPIYLAAADLFVFPSQNRLEGFGLAVAEAMAAGLPSVIADMPGVREVIDPGVEGLLSEPLLVSDLIAKVRELLDDEGRRHRMGAAARRGAEERYALPKVVRQLRALYGALAGAG